MKKIISLIVGCGFVFWAFSSYALIGIKQDQADTEADMQAKVAEVMRTVHEEKLRLKRKPFAPKTDKISITDKIRIKEKIETKVEKAELLEPIEPIEPRKNILAAIVSSIVLLGLILCLLKAKKRR